MRRLRGRGAGPNRKTARRAAALRRRRQRRDGGFGDALRDFVEIDEGGGLGARESDGASGSDERLSRRRGQGVLESDRSSGRRRRGVRVGPRKGDVGRRGARARGGVARAPRDGGRTRRRGCPDVTSGAEGVGAARGGGGRGGQTRRRLGRARAGPPRARARGRPRVREEAGVRARVPRLRRLRDADSGDARAPGGSGPRYGAERRPDAPATGDGARRGQRGQGFVGGAIERGRGHAYGGRGRLGRGGRRRAVGVQSRAF
mmetsp:Transcript_4106/g.12830  ORF Transcript_4106/g.12830 Transcript_4106/m.12830 type:complete len:260 (-) Transcript_4106:68-847(-)